MANVASESESSPFENPLVLHVDSSRVDLSHHRLRQHFGPRATPQPRHESHRNVVDCCQPIASFHFRTRAWSLPQVGKGRKGRFGRLERVQGTGAFVGSARRMTEAAQRARWRASSHLSMLEGRRSCRYCCASRQSFFYFISELMSGRVDAFCPL